MSASRTPIWVFFALIVMLSIPFWILGAIVGDIPKEQLSIDLPVAALMAFLPMAVALILTAREEGWAGARQLLARLVDVRRDAAGWYIVAALALPVAMVIEYFALRLMDAPLPDPVIPLASLGGFLVMFTVGGIGEELGWQGYVYPRLRDGRTALAAALIISAFWSVWHLIPFLQAHRAPDWILWQSLGMFPMRIITVWIYENAKQSVFAAVVFHAMGNVAQFLFPNYGSHYDPFVTFVILGLFTLAIIALWGPATLAQFRFGRTRAS